MAVQVGTTLSVGDLEITFQRSTKLAAGAPPARVRSFGALPVARLTADMAIVPLADEESVWLGLEGRNPTTPCALRVLVVGVSLEDAVSGTVPAVHLADAPQNYIVVPPQGWLEGATAADACARQFVRRPDGEHQQVVHEFRLSVVPLRSTMAGLAPGVPQAPRRAVGPHRPSAWSTHRPPACQQAGHLERHLAPDSHGVGAWDVASASRVRVQLVSGPEYQRLSGSGPPPPIDLSAAYRGWRLP